MKLKLAAALSAGLFLSACAASDPGPQSAQRETAITRTARVQTVDLDTRQVLLRMDDDAMLSLVAGPEVRNLPQLEPGDVVRFEYYEAVAVTMVEPGTTGNATGAVVATRAPEGAKPGAGLGATANMVVEFISYDPTTHVATFRAPDGVVETATVKPELQAFAAARKAGDRIDLTITRAVAVSIDEAGG